MLTFLEAKDLVVGKDYHFIDCEKVPAFFIEPCVGGMSSGIQMKWRVRFIKEEPERALVVMTDVPFFIAEKMFIIQYSIQLADLPVGYFVHLVKHVEPSK